MLITVHWCIIQAAQHETDCWPHTHKSPFKSHHFNHKCHEICSLSQHFYMYRYKMSKLESNLTIFHGLNDQDSPFFL